MPAEHFIAEDFDVKRDMDLMREILLKIESKPDLIPKTIEMPEYDREVVGRQTELLFDNGFIDGIDQRNMSESFRYIFARDLTWSGHDFLDSVRDPEIWEKTKKGVSEAKSFSFELLKALAKGFAKKQIEEKTGISLDI